MMFPYGSKTTRIRHTSADIEKASAAVWRNVVGLAARLRLGKRVEVDPPFKIPPFICLQSRVERELAL